MVRKKKTPAYSKKTADSNNGHGKSEPDKTKPNNKGQYIETNGLLEEKVKIADEIFNS